MHKMITLSFKRSAKSTVRNSRQNMKIVRRRNFIHEHFEVPLAVKMLKLPLQKRILQVGCGIGIALPPLTYLCQPTRLVGIDINEKFLKRAKRRLRVREIYAELFLEDVRRMPFPDAFFDMVIDFGLCYHLRQNDFALLEIARVLTMIHRNIFMKLQLHFLIVILLTNTAYSKNASQELVTLHEAMGPVIDANENERFYLFSRDVGLIAAKVYHRSPDKWLLHLLGEKDGKPWMLIRSLSAEQKMKLTNRIRIGLNKQKVENEKSPPFSAPVYKIELPLEFATDRPVKMKLEDNTELYGRLIQCRQDTIQFLTLTDLKIEIPENKIQFKIQVMHIYLLSGLASLRFNFMNNAGVKIKITRSCFCIKVMNLNWNLLDVKIKIP